MNIFFVWLFPFAFSCCQIRKRTWLFPLAIRANLRAWTAVASLFTNAVILWPIARTTLMKMNAKNWGFLPTIWKPYRLRGPMGAVLSLIYHLWLKRFPRLVWLVNYNSQFDQSQFIRSITISTIWSASVTNLHLRLGIKWILSTNTLLSRVWSYIRPDSVIFVFFLFPFSFHFHFHCHFQSISRLTFPSFFSFVDICH